MNLQISRHLYTFLFYWAIPFIYLRLYWRGRSNPGYRRRGLERLGIFKPPANTTALWIHAVSLGEVNACAPLVKALLLDDTLGSITITTMTPTGSQQVAALFADRVFHVYAPYDIPVAINRFLDRIKPQCYIIIETELWPNTLHQCCKRNIPVLLANARLSEKSFRGYQRLSSVTQWIMNNLSMVAAHAQADANRFIKLGLPKDKIRVAGNLKFDVSLTPALQKKAKQLRHSIQNRSVLVAASTHPGEDPMILTVFEQLLKRHPNMLLILVPRHPERFNEVYELCLHAGHNTVKRSSNQAVTDDTQILLGDTLGELMLFYGVSDVSFVGGSLIPRGGHNVLEPALWARPIITGVHTFNFAPIIQLLAHTKGLVQVQQYQEMVPIIDDWFTHKQRAEKIGKINAQLIKENQGALAEHLSIIKKLNTSLT